MDVSIIIFIVVSLGALILGFLLEGGHFLALFIGTAALIVFGGTIGAVGLSFPMEELKRLPKVLGVLFKYKPVDPTSLVSQMFEYATVARKEGLLALEKHATTTKEEERFLAKGLAFVVDGVENEVIRKTLETDAENITERHETAISIFEAAGGYSPTMGIIGTVMGLVHVLGNLEDPSSLGPKIAVAFIATLYGVGTANLLWLPIANRLKVINEKELRRNQMVIEGISSLQQGKNPKLVVADMCSFLNPIEREKALQAVNLGENHEKER
ncbi:MAG: flagellar motor protein [Cellulosilyticaceae bacterium]